MAAAAWEVAGAAGSAPQNGAEAGATGAGASPRSRVTASPMGKIPPHLKHMARPVFTADPVRFQAIRG